ncbi:MAG: tetratricopeptide repeat protein [Planctomycetota bacterium]
MLLVIAGVWMTRTWIAEIPNSLARRAISLRTPERALRILEWSESIGGRTAPTEFLRARACRRLGRWDDATRHLKNASSMGGDRTLLQREDWLMKAQSGQMMLVHNHRNQMLLDPRGETEEICEAYVIGYISIQHFTEATRLIESWSADYPENAEPHYLKGLILAEENKLRLAEESFEKALQISPDHFQARLALANTLLTERKEQEALPHFQRCLRQQTNAKVQVGLAKCLLAVGDLETAGHVLEKGAVAFPDDFNLHLEQGRFLLNENFDAAKKALETAHRLQPNSSEAQYLLAQALIRLGRGDEATPYLSFVTRANQQLAEMAQALKKISENPDDVDARLQVGAIQLEFGTEREALLWLQSVIYLDPQNVQANLSLANFYEKKSSESPQAAELARYFRRAAETATAP